MKIAIKQKLKIQLGTYLSKCHQMIHFRFSDLIDICCRLGAPFLKSSRKHCKLTQPFTAAVKQLIVGHIECDKGIHKGSFTSAFLAAARPPGLASA